MHKKTLLITSIAISIAFGTPRSNAASTDSSLDTNVEIFSSTTGSEFVALCRKLNRPCGEETRCHDPQDTRALKIHLKKTTPKKALDQIVRMHPAYRWEIRDGVLNWEPAHRTHPDLLAELLDQISIHGVSARDAYFQVFKQAGIQVNWFYSGPPPTYASIDLDMQHRTVREVLNAIAKIDGQHVWRFCSDEASGTTGSFTLSTWKASSTTSQTK